MCAVQVAASDDLNITPDRASTQDSGVEMQRYKDAYVVPTLLAVTHALVYKTDIFMFNALLSTVIDYISLTPLSSSKQNWDLTKDLVFNNARLTPTHFNPKGETDNYPGFPGFLSEFM